MKLDERDERLAELFEREVRSFAPSDRFPSVLSRGARRRIVRYTAVAATLAMFVGAVTWTALHLQRNTTHWASIAGPNHEWHVSYPSGWHVTPVSQKCSSSGSAGGVIVSNVAFRFRHPRTQLSGCLDRYVMAGFPSGGVAVALQPVGGSSGPIVREPDTAFPLTASQLFADGGIRGGPRESYIAITIHGEPTYDLREWVGRDATETDRIELDRAIASVDFPGAPRWRTHDSRFGYTLSYPSGWAKIATHLHGPPGSPSSFFETASYSLRGVRPECHASQAGILLRITEGSPTGTRASYPARPQRFTPGPPDRRVCGNRQHEWEINFQEAGNAFSVEIDVAVGDPGYLRNTAFRILNSLRLELARGDQEYQSPGGTWRLDYSRRWHLTTLSSSCGPAPSPDAAVVSNVGFAFRRPGPSSTGGLACDGRPVLEGFPADGVALYIQDLSFPPHMPGWSLPNTAFPLRLRDFLVWPGRSLGPLEVFQHVDVGGGEAYDVRAWIGPDASPADRAELGAVVSSFEIDGAPRWLTYKSPYGFTVSYPGSWVLGSVPISHGTSRTVLELSSGDLRTSPDGCAYIRRGPHVSPFDALVTLRADTLFSNISYPPPPARFSSMQTASTPSPECFARTGFSRSSNFEVNGRSFTVTVNVGTDASLSLRKDVFRTLDSLRFDANG